MDAVNPSPSTPYLQFSSTDALKSAIGEISKSSGTNKASVIADVIRAHASGESGDNFRSLLIHPEKNVPVLSAKGTAARKSGGKNVGVASSAPSSARTALAEDEVFTDQLVPDPNFAAVLNDELEIQVGNQIIKVTPQGTYFADAANKTALEQMANDNLPDSLDYTPGTLVGENLYAMGNGITR